MGMIGNWWMESCIARRDRLTALKNPERQPRCMKCRPHQHADRRSECVWSDVLKGSDQPEPPACLPACFTHCWAEQQVVSCECFSRTETPSHKFALIFGWCKLFASLFSHPRKVKSPLSFFLFCLRICHQFDKTNKQVGLAENLLIYQLNLNSDTNWGNIFFFYKIKFN